MGLAERRMLKEFQEKSFPDLKKKIVEAAGYNVSLDIDWEKLATEGNETLYKDGFTSVYFKPLIDGLKAITIDDEGRTALKKGLKAIKVTNTSAIYSPSGITFEKGTLQIDHDPITNMNDVKDRTEAIVKVLEKNL